MQGRLEIAEILENFRSRKMLPNRLIQKYREGFRPVGWTNDDEDELFQPAAEAEEAESSDDTNSSDDEIPSEGEIAQSDVIAEGENRDASEGRGGGGLQASVEPPTASEGPMPQNADEGRENALFAGKWPVKPLEKGESIAERKNNWIKWRKQFDLVLQLRGSKDPEKNLAALKIYIGSESLALVEWQERGVRNGSLPSSDSIYESVMKALDTHFARAQDERAEQNKLRTIKMKDNEIIEDYAMRVEEQLQLCNYNAESDKHEEEMVSALMYRSTPTMAKELQAFVRTMESIQGTKVHSSTLIHYGMGMQGIKEGLETEEKLKKPEDAIKAEESKPVPVMAVKREYSGSYRGGSRGYVRKET